MKHFFYPRLAFSNIKRNAKFYIPYVLTCIFTISLFYIMLSISRNDSLETMAGGNSLLYMLSFGVSVIAIFSAIFLFYTNSFLIKRRKKEIALYTILGMEKRHIVKMLTYETFFTALVSLAIGIGIGILLSKLLFLLLLNIIGITTTLVFKIPILAIYTTCILFATIFLIILLSTILQIRVVSPIELLSGSKTGEKEPKSKWIITLVGFISLASGYYLALTIVSPLDAFAMFFVAVILVIIGTYMLFVSGSITLLKWLKKNKKLYYRTKYFTVISGMLYRMKQNAVGLANICILSTCVIVILSTTTSLYAGLENALETRYACDVIVQVETPDKAEEIKAIYLEEIDKYQVETKDLLAYQDTIIACNQKDTTFSPSDTLQYMADATVHIQTLEQYNAINNQKVVLQPEEVLSYNIHEEAPLKSMTFIDQKYTTKEIEKPKMLFEVQNLVHNYLFVVPNQATYDTIIANFPSVDTPYIFAFDFTKDEVTENEIAFMKDFREGVETKITGSYVEARELSREAFMAEYGGMFFLGIFLGTLFLMTVTLIIYYKQISEGYEDVDRYTIMQKVGMDKREVKASINLQILLVFFLPLVVAIIHFGFAFNMITKLLSLFNLTNVTVFIIGSAITISVFALLYSVIYYITSKIYYRIVN